MGKNKVYLRKFFDTFQVMIRTKYSKHKLIEDKVVETCRNVTWEYNHTIIRDSYVNLIKSLKRKPTYPEVSEDTKLSENTVKKHIDKLKFDLQKHPLRILSDDVLIAIAKAAIDGNTQSQKLWMQLCEGWSEKQIREYQGDININTEFDFTGITDKELEMLEALGMKQFQNNVKQLPKHGIRNN